MGLLSKLVTKEGVEAQINFSEQKLQEIQVKYNLFYLKQELLNQINAVKENEKIFLHALNANSIQEVNERLNRIRENMPGIKNLNGTQLTNEFLISAEQSYRAKTNQDEADFFKFMAEEEGYQSSFPTTEEFQNWFQGILGSVLVNGKGVSITSTRGYANATSLDQVVLKKLSAAQKKRIQEYLKQKRNTNISGNTELSNNSVTSSINIPDWSSLTLGMKEKEVRDMLDKGQMSHSELQRILASLVSLIISKVGSDPIFLQAVREVIYQPDSLTKVFYGGNIVNGITGLLGEIQGLYYIKALLNNPDAKGNGASVSWVGGIGNPHEDLILFFKGRATGIQIKNTAKDLEEIKRLSNVSFISRQVDNFDFIQSKLGAYYDELVTIYAMNAFNIEVDIEGGYPYKPGYNEEFNATRQRIVSLRQQVDRVMTIFTSSLMYMAAIESTNGISTGNSVYLLGGTTFQLASEILVNLYSQIEQGTQPDLKVTSHFNKGVNEVGTIADYFNAKHKTHGGSVTRTLGTLFLTSSYSFKL